MKREAVFLILNGDKRKDAFMKSCDVWEEGRFLADEEYLTAEYTEEVTMELAGKAVKGLQEAYETAGRNVVFVQLLRIINGKIVTKNKSQVEPYVNFKVRTVSDGKKFFLLSDYLKERKIEHETNQQLFITKIN